MGEDRSQLAASRRRQSEERSDELRTLRARLAAGELITSDDLALAERRAAESQRNAERAKNDATSAHLRAAEAHASAARLYELMGHEELAELHRQAAAADESWLERVEPT
jgi:hypothetical protein